jgi:CHAD domain-containing protein
VASNDLENVRRLRKKLRENLARCADDPDVDPVHDTRTGTRRLQATLEDLVRETSPGTSKEGPGEESVREAATAAMKVLKKIRREAGPVRDLDVHRELLEKLTQRAQVKVVEEAQAPEGQNAADAQVGFEISGLAPHPTALEQQAEHLDAWLKHRRGELADGLRGQAPDLVEKLDKRIEEVEQALRTRRSRVGRKKPPGVVALDSFARLASEMQMLDATNLHDFRKGAKKARYVAELAAQGDAQARQVGETLKKLQDEIGDWHDWLVLAEEAHTALGDGATELIALLEAERERHFVAAMKTAAKLRGRLMGEWLAVTRRPVARATSATHRVSIRRQRRAHS